MSSSRSEGDTGPEVEVSYVPAGPFPHHAGLGLMILTAIYEPLRRTRSVVQSHTVALSFGRIYATTDWHSTRPILTAIPWTSFRRTKYDLARTGNQPR